MAQVKRAGYPSRQHRAGPAPLASFEDLPSDELESPDSLAELEECTISSQASRPVDFDGSSTPRTLTASALSTPQLDSDGDSQFTLTPCDTVKGQIPGSLKTSSLSSLKNGKEDDQVSVSSTGHKKGSVSSLLSSGESSRPSREGSHRKGSWTDIFRSRSRSRSRSPQGSPRRLRKGSDTSAKCRSDTESNERNGSVSKKEKSKFLSSLFKIGNKKSPKSKSPSPPKSSLESQDDLGVEIAKNKSTLNTAYSQKDELHKPFQAKVDLTNQIAVPPEKISTVKNEAVAVPKEEKRNRPTEIDLESVHGLPTTHNWQRHEEADIIPNKLSDAELLEQHKNEKEISPPHVSDIEGNHESSESELTFEVNGSSKPPLEEDYEAETLLNQDSTDAEEFSAAEFQLPPPPVDSSHSQIKTPTRKQRLEVTTIPIERPRSTTPINIAPLEAFIQSATPSPDPGVEKIRLSLPGDQFGSRPRSPKKSSIKSWQDFCEEGLHSPRLNKRPQNDDDDDDEFDLQLKSPDFETDIGEIEDQTKYKLHENVSSEEASWVTFENIHDDRLLRKPNTLDVATEKDQKWKGDCSLDNDAFQSGDLEKNKNLFTDCSCVCHLCGCDCHFVTVDVVNGKLSRNSNSVILGAKELSSDTLESDSQVESNADKQDSSFQCECDCHKQVTDTAVPHCKQAQGKCEGGASPVDQHFTLQEQHK